MGAIIEACIRDAMAGDLADINRIYNVAVLESTATWDETPWPMERRETWFRDHGPETPILVAEINGELAGFAYLTLMSQKSGWRFTREDTIYLDERFRGRGLGRTVLTALLERGRAIGVRVVVASITSENTASLALHRSLGFETVGELRHAGRKFGRWLSTTYLQRDLGVPGDNTL